MTQRTLKSIRIETLLSNIRDAQIVVRTADETFSDNNETFAGIFEMLAHKMDMIENNAVELFQMDLQPSAGAEGGLAVDLLKCRR